jgi:hypothetical protein
MNLINDKSEWITVEDFSNVIHWSIRKLWTGEDYLCN